MGQESDSGSEILEPGHELAGRYRIVRLLGMGAVGAVYEVEHIELHRRFALKVLLRKFFRNELMHARFMLEARTCASIRHPGIVEVFDLGTDGDVTFITMELLEGEELIAKVRREHPLPPSFVVGVGYDLADAVAAAHEHGVVHRDLKPQNIFLARQGRRRDVVKVLDFGLAKVIKGHKGMQLTKTGDVFGSPVYISPEQLRDAKSTDHRVDIYAIGVILFEAFAGVPPFVDKSFYELVLKIATKQPPPLDSLRGDVPRELVGIVHRAMEKDRAQRYQRASELRDALAEHLDGVS